MTELDPRKHEQPRQPEREDGEDEGLIVVGRDIPPPSEVNDTIVMGAAIVTGVCGVVFGVTIVAGLGVTVPGLALGVGLLSLAVAVRRYFAAAYPSIEGAEPRHGGGTDDEPVAEVSPVGRRSLLQRLLIGAAALFGVGLAAPVTSLGPAPSGALRGTKWTSGSRLVTSKGNPLRPEHVPVGGVASTIWPEGHIRVESAAVVLVRLSAQPSEPTNLDWVVDGNVVAYSKVCTHAGCPVGLFREQGNALFCPCHQSTFNAARGAIPTFGPATRALPQLPLGVDEEGFLVATGEFTQRVGPAVG